MILRGSGHMLPISETDMKFTIFPAAWSLYLQAILRIMPGLLFVEHGAGKLLGFPALAGLDQLPHGLLVFTGSMELFGGALFVLGFLTRPAAFILSGFMAAAYFMAHAPMGFFPINNHGELAVLYCFVFLYFAVTGAPVWSVDALLSPRKGESSRQGGLVQRGAGQ
jgi:putative oxidoreductase